MCVCVCTVLASSVLPPAANLCGLAEDLLPSPTPDGTAWWTHRVALLKPRAAWKSRGNIFVAFGAAET